jgi:hypothetical protein
VSGGCAQAGRSPRSCSRKSTSRRSCSAVRSPFSEPFAHPKRSSVAVHSENLHHRPLVRVGVSRLEGNNAVLVIIFPGWSTVGFKRISPRSTTRPHHPHAHPNACTLLKRVLRLVPRVSAVGRVGSGAGANYIILRNGQHRPRVFGTRCPQRPWWVVLRDAPLCGTFTS